MKRGFITIATGNIHYYEIAANLLKSYKFFSKNPYPFAIIAEEHNQYTDAFDDVIITDESTHSFMDKMLLMKLCPYDETIFIDADSLVYDDLNAYWEFFKYATDFSSIGTNVPKDSTEGAWYNIDGIGKYGDLINYKTRVHTGVCFIRKSEGLKKLYDDCMELINDYDQLYFHTCSSSKDECVLGVAMPMNNMKATRENPAMLAAYPCLTYLKADMFNKNLSYSTDWAGYTKKGLLLHWGTDQTYEPLYIFNVECLNYLLSSDDCVVTKLKYKYKLRYFSLLIPFVISKNYKRFIRLCNKLLSK